VQRAPATSVKFTSEAAEPLDFDAIVLTYRSRVFRFALVSLRDRDAAETIAQDCFLKAHQALPTFRGECSLSTWLMRIAVNLIRDYTRNRRLRFWRQLGKHASSFDAMRETCGDNASTPEERAVLNQQVRAVWDVAARLPDRQRTVFLLRFVEDMDILEIAEATGLKEGTVKVHLFRALEAVRKRIAKP
jgi:RNA polymerase sigma-70 factor, ECF subfamily